MTDKKPDFLDECGSSADVVMDDTSIKVYGVGDYGTGKSTFAATFPVPGFVIDFDGRIASYRDHDWKYKTYAKTNKGWCMFERDFGQIAKMAVEGKLATVVLDSTTSMTDAAMGRALTLDPNRGPQNGPVWNIHYGIVKNLVEPKLLQLLSLPCNVVVLGHWDLKKDSKTGNILGAEPMLTGQLSIKVPGYFDEVYAFFTENGPKGERFFFRTVSWGYYKARSTLSGKLRLLPDKIDNDYQSLMELTTKALERDREERTKAIEHA